MILYYQLKKKGKKWKKYCKEVTRYMDSNDYIKMAVYKELEEALQLKRINEELLEYLGAPLRWLCHYSKKYNISLPENDKIDLLIDRTLEITNKMPKPFSPNFKHPNGTPRDSTEPKFSFISTYLGYDLVY